MEEFDTDTLLPPVGLLNTNPKICTVSEIEEVTDLK